MPTPGSIPNLLKRRWMGTEEPPPGACFKCGKLATGQETDLHLNCCPSYYPNCGQAGHLGVNWPTLPRQARLITQVPTPRESLSDLLDLAAED